MKKLRVKKVLLRLKDNKKVVVHCKYGQARSGTFLAGYLIHIGKDYEEALNTVLSKGFTPHTDYQLKFLKDYYSKLKKDG